MTDHVAAPPIDADVRALLVRAARRDPDAWEALYRRSYHRLCGFARRRGFDAEVAEDLVSETMTRALDHIDRFTWQAAGFDAWLYGVARNVAAEYVRAGRRPQPAAEVDTPAGPASPGSPSAALRVAFARLDADDREVLELRVSGGLSAEAVAELLGKQAGAVRMAEARALQRLRVLHDEVRS